MQQLDTIPELPRLESGVTLLRTTAETRPVQPLQSLLVDTLLLGDGGDHAVWVDALDHARTDVLASLAPAPRLLDRVQVARGFTAYQHAAIVERLFDACREGGSATGLDVDSLSLVVCPAVDALYREDDVPPETAGPLCYRVLAWLRTIARDLDVPVLVTCWRDDDFAAPFETAATDVVTCRETPLGVRFESDDTETLVYPLDDGTVQTTLAYWAEILRARRPLYERYGLGEPRPIGPDALRG
jgi:hypothetical protein